MTDETIPFGRPLLDQSEIDAVVKVLSGPILAHGPVSREFEAAFAERAGAAHAISVSSGTAGLHLCLFASDIGPGDEVIVPAMTHVATAHSVEFCGAKPIFADVDPASGNIDPDAVVAALGGSTKAVMVVHYLGLPCDMDRINTDATRVGATVFEDAALALDGTYGGRKAGTLAKAGCFSFYPIKHMTSIEGGMVTTNDDALADQIRRRKAFGYDRTHEQRVKPGIYDVDRLGYNYRMNEVEAAVGLAQIAKLDERLAIRERNYSRLMTLLAEIDEVTVFAPEQGKAKSSCYCLNAVLPRDGSLDRDAVAAHLKDRGIGTSVHYPGAVPLMSYYADKYGHRPGQFPVAEWLAAQTISLPVAPHVPEGGPERIAAAMKEAIVAVKKAA
jgi:perosamine synthetase